ncbi:hypothetical protein VTN77DRAFT_7284 [Rasamsonia byssochlamydoides]|uniref:uncharacterized protein n=1 Tax=Rasamsonia byssochlamydoides TaxID=89139 RepID=UPI00374233A5
MDEANTRFGKRLNVAAQQKQKLIDAGFVNVRDDIYKLPIGTWPKDPKLKEIDRFFLAQTFDAVDSFTTALFTRVLGCSTAFHLYVNFHFIYGQKLEEN